MATTAELLAGLKQKIITLGEQKPASTFNWAENGTLGGEVVLPDSVTSIATSAFQNSRITSIHIPNSVTSIGDKAFYACTNLTHIDIPDLVATIGGSSFYDCTSLETIKLSKNLKYIYGSTFANCKKLISIILPKSVERMEYEAFRNCISLTDVFLPNSLSKITRNPFIGCTNLTNVTLGDGFNCDGLDLSASTKFTADTIKNMFIALADRTGLTAYTLTLGANNLAKLTEEEKQIATNKNWNLA